MAILIPSKNIYQIENSKIIDNAIDKVTVSGNNISPKNEYDQTVYQETFTPPFDSKDTPSISSVADSKYNSQTGAIAHNYYAEAISYAYMRTIYREGIYVTIPKYTDRTRITKILKGINANGEPNIKHSVKYIKKTATANGRATVSTNSNGVLSTKNPSVDNIAHGALTETEGVGEISNISTSTGANLELKDGTIYFTKATKQGGAGLGVSAEAVAICNLQNHTNTGTISVTESDTNFYISGLTVLAGVELYDLAYSYYKQSTPQDQNVFPSGSYRYLTGTYTYYEPVSVDISIQGDVFTLDISNMDFETGSGNKPCSLNGSELMQQATTTNGQQTTQVLANTIINDYKNGKETATILCDINDYYQYRTEYENRKGELVITPAKTLPRNTVIVEPKKDYPTSLNPFRIHARKTLSKIMPYLYDIEVSATVKGKRNVSNNTFYPELIDAEKHYTAIIKKDEESVILAPFDTTSRLYSIDSIAVQVSSVNYPIKMSFDLHDIVIPMVMGSDGKDYPMSKNKDNTPKLFEVVGVKKYYDGAVWQELTLQEYKTV